MTPLKMLNSFTHQHYKHDHCRLTLQLSNPLLTTSFYCISTITFDPAALFIGWPNIFILPLIHLQCDFIDVSVIEFCKYCSNNTILRITSSIRCHIYSITLLCSLSIPMYVCILLCLLWFVDYSSDSVCYQYICLSIIFVCLC